MSSDATATAVPEISRALSLARWLLSSNLDRVSGIITWLKLTRLLFDYIIRFFFSQVRGTDLKTCRNPVRGRVEVNVGYPPN